MNWYYVANGQQVGPLTEADFGAAVTSGAITPATLVWHEGMAKWQPYAEVGATAPAAGPGGGVVCSECQREFPADAVISIGNANVCATCKPIFMQKIKEGAVPTGEMEYAGFWIRAGAKIIDSLILGAASLLLLLPMGLLMGAESPAAVIGMQLAFQGVWLLVAGAYTVFFLGKYGATPGKMLVKIKVVMADGAPLSYGRSAGRFFGDILSGMICYIGYLMVAFDKEERRALHDRICNTRVVRR